MSAEGLAGVVAEEGAFDEGGDVFLFFGGELVDGFELEAQGLILGAAFVVVEQERVSAYVERERGLKVRVGWCDLGEEGWFHHRRHPGRSPPAAPLP